MSEAIYSTIKEGEKGKLIRVSLPYHPSMVETEEDIALAQAIHDDIQKRVQEWFDEEFARSLYA